MHLHSAESVDTLSRRVPLLDLEEPSFSSSSFALRGRETQLGQPLPAVKFLGLQDPWRPGRLPGHIIALRPWQYARPKGLCSSPASTDSKTVARPSRSIPL